MNNDDNMENQIDISHIVNNNNLLKFNKNINYNIYLFIYLDIYIIICVILIINL